MSRLIPSLATASLMLTQPLRGLGSSLKMGQTFWTLAVNQLAPALNLFQPMKK
jgi:hypothetical protein